MQVDIHMEDNDNFEDEHDHVVDNSSIVSNQMIPFLISP